MPRFFKSGPETGGDSNKVTAMSLYGELTGAARVVLLLAVPLLPGCVSLQVESLVGEPYRARPDGTVVQALEAEPAQPHVKLARLIATSQSADEDDLRNKIMARARQLGADAVVLGKADVLEGMGTGMGQSYGSTLDPGVPNSVFGGLGSGMPFFFDPWTYVQSTSDREEWTLYLSGVAIRYLDERAPGGV